MNSDEFNPVVCSWVSVVTKTQDKDQEGNEDEFNNSNKGNRRPPHHPHRETTQTHIKYKTHTHSPANTQEVS